jgi:hypothetical protein
MVKNSAGEPEVLLFLSLPACEMLDLSPPHCVCPASSLGSFLITTSDGLCSAD